MALVGGINMRSRDGASAAQHQMSPFRCVSKGYGSKKPRSCPISPIHYSEHARMRVGCRRRLDEHSAPDHARIATPEIRLLQATENGCRWSCVDIAEASFCERDESIRQRNSFSQCVVAPVVW